MCPQLDFYTRTRIIGDDCLSCAVVAQLTFVTHSHACSLSGFRPKKNNCTIGNAPRVIISLASRHHENASCMFGWREAEIYDSITNRTQLQLWTADLLGKLFEKSTDNLHSRADRRKSSLDGGASKPKRLMSN